MEDIFGSCRCHSHYRCKINPADRERESKNRLHILGYENSLQMAPQSQKKNKKKEEATEKHFFKGRKTERNAAGKFQQTKLRQQQRAKPS